MNTIFKHRNPNATCVYNGNVYTIKVGSQLSSTCQSSGLQRYAWRKCIRDLEVIDEIYLPSLNLVHDLICGIYVPEDEMVTGWETITDGQA